MPETPVGLPETPVGDRSLPRFRLSVFRRGSQHGREGAPGLAASFFVTGDGICWGWEERQSFHLRLCGSSPPQIQFCLAESPDAASKSGRLAGENPLVFKQTEPRKPGG